MSSVKSFTRGIWPTRWQKTNFNFSFGLVNSTTFTNYIVIEWRRIFLTRSQNHLKRSLVIRMKFDTCSFFSQIGTLNGPFKNGFALHLVNLEKKYLYHEENVPNLGILGLERERRQIVKDFVSLVNDI